MVKEASKEFQEDLLRRMRMLEFHKPKEFETIAEIMKPSIQILKVCDEIFTEEEIQEYHRLAKKIIESYNRILKKEKMMAIMPAVELVRLNFLSATFDKFAKDILGENKDGQ